MSTIEVTNINDVSGNASLVTDNGGLKTDKLTGKTTAGSISVVGEGNSTTTNLQQGLCKCWGHFEGSDTTLDDSFNTTSITDNGLGNYTVTIANDMSNANYSLSIGADWDTASSSTCHGSSNTVATGTFVIRLRNGGSDADRDNVTYNVAGDLA